MTDFKNNNSRKSKHILKNDFDFEFEKDADLKTSSSSKTLNNEIEDDDEDFYKEEAEISDAIKSILGSSSIKYNQTDFSVKVEVEEFEENELTDSCKVYNDNVVVKNEPIVDSDDDDDVIFIDNNVECVEINNDSENEDQIFKESENEIDNISENILAKNKDKSAEVNLNQDMIRNLEEMFQNISNIYKYSKNEGEKLLAVEFGNSWGRSICGNFDLLQTGPELERGLHVVIKKWLIWQRSAGKVRDEPTCYKCYICNKGWWYFYPFRIHLQMYHQDLNKIVFNIEQIENDSSIICYSASSTSMKPSISDTVMEGNCPKCNNPMGNHVLSSAMCYMCYICYEKFPTCLKLYNHLFTHQKKSLQCSICSYSTDENNNLNKHMQLKHCVRSDILTFIVMKTCRSCNVRYIYFRAHECKYLVGKKPCCYCRRQLITSYFQELHISRNKQLVKCLIHANCNVVAKPCKMLEHYLAHSTYFTQAYKCSVCVKPIVYCSLDSLLSHQCENYSERIKRKRNYVLVIVLKSYLNKCKKITLEKPIKITNEDKINDAVNNKKPENMLILRKVTSESVKPLMRPSAQNNDEADIKLQDASKSIICIKETSSTIPIKPENNEKKSCFYTETLEASNNLAKNSKIIQDIVEEKHLCRKTLEDSNNKEENSKTTRDADEENFLYTEILEDSENEIETENIYGDTKPIKVSEIKSEVECQDNDVMVIDNDDREFLISSDYEDDSNNDPQSSKEIRYEDVDEKNTLLTQQLECSEDEPQTEKIVYIKKEPNVDNDYSLNTKVEYDVEYEIKQEDFSAFEDKMNELHKKSYKINRNNEMRTINYDNSSDTEDKTTEKSQNKTYPCTKCPENNEYRSLKEYFKHLVKHGLALWECPVCLKQSINSSSMTLHIFPHIRATFLPVFLLDKNDIMSQKNKRVKSKYRDFQCKKCNKVMKKNAFFKHWESHLCLNTTDAVLRLMKQEDLDSTEAPVAHSNASTDHKLPRGKAMSQETMKKVFVIFENKPYEKTCFICGRLIARYNELKRHLIEHLLSDAFEKSTQAGGLQCQVCFQKFKSSYPYRCHMREHAYMPVFKCEMCQKTFSDSSNFTKHKKVHNIGVLLCDICNKKFNTKKMLRVHLQTHADNKTYKCTLCSMTFTQPSFLKRHRRLHSSVSYRCDLCTESFTSLKMKWTHMWVTHKTSKTRADCPICHRSFRRWLDVKKHMGEIHHLPSPNSDN